VAGHSGGYSGGYAASSPLRTMIEKSLGIANAEAARMGRREITRMITRLFFVWELSGTGVVLLADTS